RSGRVVDAGVPDNLVEGRVELVQELEVLRLTGAVVEPRLVDALEDQLMGLVAELVGDLGPGRVEAVEHVVVVGGHAGDPQPRVVVYVEHHVEFSRQGPVDNLLDPVQPRRFDGVGRRGTLVLVPGHRDPDAVEALRRDVLDQRLGDDGVAPGRLIWTDRVERVAEVPARLHILHDLHDITGRWRVRRGWRGRWRGGRCGRGLGRGLGGRLAVARYAVEGDGGGRTREPGAVEPDLGLAQV